MNNNNRLNVLFISEVCNPDGVGESQNAYSWASRLSEHCNMTLLCVKPKNLKSPAHALPGVEVVPWEMPDFYNKYPSFRQRVKPHYVAYYIWAKRWIKNAIKSGKKFDLGHQITPNGARYPSPLYGSGIPYLMGPIGGTLRTPEGFEEECNTSSPLFTKLRGLDSLRFKFDPLLRGTYKEAEIVIGSSAYVRDVLKDIPLKRFETQVEFGHDELGEDRPVRDRKPGELKMLHVGRTVRTKGLRDGIRAMAMLKDELPNLSLTCIGDGEDQPLCKKEAEDLGIADRVHFLGRIPREDIEQHYRNSDVFLFPSFREPAGAVLFEAMRHSVPVITTNLGGPGSIVDDKSGIRVKAENPQQMANDLAEAIRKLATDDNLLKELSEGARQRVAEKGLWSAKIESMLALYNDVAKVDTPPR